MKSCISRFIFLTTALVIVVFQGCSVKKPSPLSLQKNLPGHWTFDKTLSLLPVTSGLLDLFNNDALEGCVQEALENNPDLKITAHRLDSSGYLLKSNRSMFFPSLTAGISRGRDNQGFNTTGRIRQDRYRGVIGMSWEADIWGKLADQYSADKFVHEIKEHEYIAARDGMAARVIQAWIHAASIKQAIGVEQKRVALLVKNEQLLIQRYRKGLGNLDELATAKTKTHSARAEIVRRKNNLGKAIRRLEVLLGRYPKGEIEPGATLPDIALVPISIPSKTLLNRPDIKSSILQVMADKALAKTAMKKSLPSLAITADLFKEAGSLSSITSSTLLWNIVGNLTATIFDAGNLKNIQLSRESESKASVQALFNTVLRAMQEIEDLVSTDQDLATREHLIAGAVKHAKKSRLYFEDRYRKGLESLPILLSAQEQEVDMKQALNEIQSERMINRIDLAIAAGGSMDTKTQN